MKKNGVTLVEILVSTVLVALIVAGLAHVFVTSRRYAVLNRSRMQAMEFNKQILDSFSKAVRQDTWEETDPEANPLTLVTDEEGATATFNYVPYESTYNVTAAPAPGATLPSPALRKVKLVVNWTEPSQR